MNGFDQESANWKEEKWKEEFRKAFEASISTMDVAYVSISTDFRRSLENVMEDAYGMGIRFRGRPQEASIIETESSYGAVESVMSHLSHVHADSKTYSMPESRKDVWIYVQCLLDCVRLSTFTLGCSGTSKYKILSENLNLISNQNSNDEIKRII